MKVYLKNSGYRALINSTVLSGIGDSLYNIVFIIYAASVPNKSLAVSLASFATLLPSLLSVVTGSLADQTHHKAKSVIIVRMIQAALFVLLAGLIKLPQSFPLFLFLLLINILSDTIGSYANGLTLPFLPRLLPEDELNAAFGLETAATTTVQIIFQGLGVALIVAMAYNYSAFAWINAATFCLAILPLKLTWPRLIKAEKEIPLSQKPDQSLLSNIADAWLELKKHSFILLTIALAVIINFLGASMNGLINVALLGERTMWLGNYGNTVALLDIILSVGTILGSLLMNDFLKNSRLLTLLLLAGASLAALGVSFIWHQALILAAVSLFAAGYIAGKVNPRISALMVREIPNEKIAAVSGFMQMSVLIGAPVGQALFLSIANMQTPQVSWILFTILATLFIVLCALLTQNKKLVMNER